MRAPNAPYTGGYSLGADLFAIDGDFTQDEPCNLPVISYPLMGDSIFSDRNIVFQGQGGFYDPLVAGYTEIPLGTFPNIQPWSANQAAAVLEQDFMVAQSAYQPLRLNTPYNPAWATGWIGAVNLQFFYLVKEGALEDMGGGISKLKRTFAVIPPTRNEVEQFVYNFVGFQDSLTGSTRQFTPINVLSRLQYDYFIFDDFGVLDLGIFPGGPKLNAATGLYPGGLILPPQYYFQNPAGFFKLLFATEVGGLSDGNGIDPSTATVPSYSQYLGFINDGAELIAEGSTMNRWMGNIFERRTRFILAQ